MCQRTAAIDKINEKEEVLCFHSSSTAGRVDTGFSYHLLSWSPSFFGPAVNIRLQFKTSFKPGTEKLGRKLYILIDCEDFSFVMLP